MIKFSKICLHQNSIFENFESNQIKSDSQGVLLSLSKLEVNNTKSCLEKGLLACRQYGSIFALILVIFPDFYVIISFMIVKDKVRLKKIKLNYYSGHPTLCQIWLRCSKKFCYIKI